jgi:hypothetical protein
MSIWIELHCDGESTTNPDCHTFKGNNPGALTRNGQESVAAAGVRNIARSRGWNMVRGAGWLCPSCQERRRP